MFLLNIMNKVPHDIGINKLLLLIKLSGKAYVYSPKNHYHLALYCAYL